MKRQALIIGAAYQDPEIPGVYDDIEVWLTFLQSPYGGWWDREEITLLVDPDARSVKKAVAALSEVDYALVIFAGHGETLKLSKPWRETVLHLGSHGYVTDSDLNPGNSRVAMILDCCRGLDNLVESVQFSAVQKSASAIPRNLRARYRELYEQAIAQAEMGLVQIFATSEGEYADDEKTFTRQLVYVAGMIIEKRRGVLPQNLAVEATAELMKEETPQQHPEYKGGRRLHHFPFAVNVG